MMDKNHVQMTLRDHLAQLAPNPPEWYWNSSGLLSSKDMLAERIDKTVRWQYQYADAVLAERAK